MGIADLSLNNWRTAAMAKLDTCKNIFPHARLTRSPDGVLEVVLHTKGRRSFSTGTPTRNSWICFIKSLRTLIIA